MQPRPTRPGLYPPTSYPTGIPAERKALYDQSFRPWFRLDPRDIVGANVWRSRHYRQPTPIRTETPQ